MPKKNQSKSWLSAEVPSDLAQEFREKAATQDRSAAQQLRRLIRRELDRDRATGS